MMKKQKKEKLERNDFIGNQVDDMIENKESHNDLISLLAISELLDLKKVKTISRIKNDQVSNISKLYLYGETFDIPFVKNLADNILQLQISINGLGRKELVQLVQQRFSDIEIEKKVNRKDIFR